MHCSGSVAPPPHLYMSSMIVVLFFSILISLINLLALLALLVMHRFVMFIHLVLSPLEASSLLAASWMSRARAPRLWAEELDTAACMRVFIVTLEVCMAIERHVVAIV